MKSPRTMLVPLLSGAAFAMPASAHFTGSITPHWHEGDAVGLLVVVALTGLAAWLDRRGR